jgi:DNA-binding transcriptional LysR family regulator
MQFDQFDLNLIRVFLAIAKHRNVTEASKQLHLTQSSVSHALARLRNLCGDLLFVRSSGGMVPTQVAQAMIEPLEKALTAIRDSLGSATPFDPRTSQRRFQLLLTDIGQLIYLPPLLEHLKEHAPQIGIDVQNLPIDDYPALFLDGAAEMAIGYVPNVVAGFHDQRLFASPQVCMLRADHPEIQGSITLAQYLAASHIVVEPPGRGPGVVEKALARARWQRNVALRLPNIFAGPLIVRRTDHIMTVPAHARFLLDDLAGMVFLPLPFETDTMHIKLLWHERTHQDPGNQWLRGVITALFAARRGPPSL